MRRKRKPVKPVGRKPRSVRIIDGAKRERTHLRRQINEETT